MKKIAFLSCGMLRTFEYCVKTWNIFDSCDIFVYTWDKTSRVLTEDLCIPNLQSLEEAKKNKLICNYEILLHNDRIKPQNKNPYLWSYASKSLSWDYDYVFLCRPDAMLSKVGNVIFPGKGEISVLGYDDEKMFTQDIILLMRRDDFVKFSQFYSFAKDLPENIHSNLYSFMKANFTINKNLGCSIKPSLNRPNVIIDDYNDASFCYNHHQEVIFWECGLKYEHAIVKSNKRKAILLITNKINTYLDRMVISKKINSPFLFFFESQSEEMARDKCAKYEEVTGLKFDEIIVEQI